MTKRLLLPVDFSEGSERATEVAAELAAAIPAAVDVLHVFDPDRDDPRRQWMELAVEPIVGDGMREFIEKHVVTQLKQVVSNLRNAGLEARGRWEAGAPSKEIVRFARSGGYSAIVMGTFGRSGFVEALIGSCAERVVRSSPIPVMVVPTHPKARGLQSLEGHWISDSDPVG